MYWNDANISMNTRAGIVDVLLRARARHEEAVTA